MNLLKTIPSRRCSLVLLLAALGSAGVVRAESTSRSAQLNVAIDAKGKASIYFVVFVLPPQPRVLEPAVREAIRLELRDVSWDVEEQKKVVSLYAQTAQSFPHALFSVEGQMDFGPCQRLLRGLQIDRFDVRLTHPSGNFSEFSLGPPRGSVREGTVEYLFQIPVNSDALPPLHFSFGYRTASLMRAALPFFACLTLVAAMIGTRRLWTVPAGASAAANAKGLRWIIGIGALSWMGWICAVAGARTDQVSLFAAGLDSDLGRVVWVSLLLWLCPAAVTLMGMHLCRRQASIQGPVSGMSPATRLWLGIEAMLGVPSMGVATGLCTLREGGGASGMIWLFLGGVLAVAVMVLSLWANSDALHLALIATPEKSEGVLGGDVVRKARIRGWLAKIVANVGIPCVALYYGRRAQWDEAARYSAMLGGVALAILVAYSLRRWGDRAASLVLGGIRPAVAARPVPRNSRRGRVLELVVLVVLAGGMSLLLRLPFDLSEGDEGWACLAMTACSTFLQR